MSRILLVARTEFLGLVRTKAFILGLLMVPAVFLISVGFQRFAAQQDSREDRRFAVLDETGVLYDALQAAAEARNTSVSDTAARSGPRFIPERAPVNASLDDMRVTLSDRVRARELFAFVELPATLLDPARDVADELRYYTNTSTYLALPNWIRETVEREVGRRRLERASVDPAEVSRLTRQAAVVSLGLVSRDPTGRVVEAERVNRFRTIGFPLIAMMLLFVAVISAAPPLVTAIVDEKATRVSEVLLSAISPAQLMAGKLLGVTAVSLLLAGLYLGAGAYMLFASGFGNLFDVGLLAWFLVFLVLAVLMYGSIFITIGAACTSLEESQAVMQPTMLLLTMPLLAASVVAQSPHSTLAVVLSLVPTATPFLMLLRLALTPPPPFWQVAAGALITALSAATFVWIAARVFRVGLLMQGKPPNLPELLRWIRK